MAFAEPVREAEFPAGVFNIITGFGHTTGDALTRHPGVAKVAFTGRTETGKRIAANLAEHLSPATLELGGKSPHVVFDDADLDRRPKYSRLKSVLIDYSGAAQDAFVMRVKLEPTT